MEIDFPLFDNDHVLGESAMRPIAPRLTRQAALLRLVGTSPPRCPPCRARLSRSLSPFALSTGTQVPVEPQRSPLPDTPITAHSGASNCRFQVYSWSSLTRLSRAELTITDKDDSAMAAAAIIGLRNPRAAIGTPMLL